MRRTFDIASRVSVLLALVAGPALSHARAAGPAPRAVQPVAALAAPEMVARSVGRTPVSAEMVVVVDGLAAARKMPAFLGLFGALTDLGLTTELKKWPTLAAQLGMSENEALDRLLGARVVLVIDSLDKGKDTPWAILSDISADTDQRIKERIPLAPRKAVDGVPVFAMERGEYELATVRTPGGEDRVTFLLGPSGRTSLFDNMVRGLLKPAQGTLADTPVIRELAEHSSPGILVAARIDPVARPGEQAAPGNWSDFLVCTAAPRDNAWECRLTVRDIAAQPHVQRVGPTSDAPFRRVSDGAMLAILESRLAATGSDGGGMFDRLLSLFAPPAGTEGILSGRQALAVWPKPRATKDAEPALCVAVALETSDVERMAPIGDRHLSQLVQTIEKVLGGDGLPVPDFAGTSSEAIRMIPLELPAKAQRLFAGPARLAWSYPAAPIPASTPKDGPRLGWWQLCIGGTGEAAGGAGGTGGAGGDCGAASVRMADALVQRGAKENEGKTDRWVSIGMMQPAQWASVARMVVEGAEEPLIPGADPVRLLQRIARVEWRLAARTNDDVGGTLRIEFTKTPP